MMVDVCKLAVPLAGWELTVRSHVIVKDMASTACSSAKIAGTIPVILKLECVLVVVTLASRESTAIKNVKFSSTAVTARLPAEHVKIIRLVTESPAPAIGDVMLATKLPTYLARPDVSVESLEPTVLSSVASARKRTHVIIAQACVKMAARLATMGRSVIGHVESTTMEKVARILAGCARTMAHVIRYLASAFTDVLMDTLATTVILQ